MIVSSDEGSVWVAHIPHENAMRKAIGTMGKINLGLWSNIVQLITNINEGQTEIKENYSASSSPPVISKVRFSGMGTGISEASKRVPIFSFATQGGKQVSSHFRQGN